MNSLAEKLKSGTFLIPAALFLLFVVVYGLTIYPGPGGRVNYNDSTWKMLLPTSEKVIPHVTGFPLFILVSKIFYYLVPAGTLWAKITAVSIVFGALTVVMVYLLSLLLSKNKWGSILAALAMGFSYTAWTQSTETEIYSMNAFFITLVAYLFIKYHLTGENRFLLWGGLAYALSFGNHLVVIWMLPALVYMVYKTDKKAFINKKIILYMLAFIILGLIPYIYLYLRFVGVNQPSVSHYLGFITGSTWRGTSMFIYDFFDFFKYRGHLFLQHLNHQFYIPGILAAVFGIASVFSPSRKNKTPFIFLLLVLFFQLFFCMNYGIHDIEVYFIPIYALLAVFMGFLLADKSYLRLKTAVLSGVIVLQLVINLGDENIRVKENERLQEMLFLLKHVPAGSWILVPKYYDNNGDYKLLSRYISLSGEYGPYKVIFQENDTRVPYSLTNCETCEEYYLTSKLDKLLSNLKKQDRFYFIGSKNKRMLEKSGKFTVTGQLPEKNKWLGTAVIRNYRKPPSSSGS